MANSGTLIGLALILGAIAAVALQPKDAAGDAPPPPGTDPGDGLPPDNQFRPVVIGEPNFQVNPF
ncbi:hypothetical protein LCGC14_0595220 [marine sediment metagenome]|uniref:Uncharacterized protein n=1 Tax=marine sediment metagenome TaxID=412755 RepID=A0A0F9UKN7_9ZZZZ